MMDFSCALSELSLALVYLVKIDKANDLRIMAESFEDSADRFYLALKDRLGSDDAVNSYLKSIIAEFGDMLR